LTARALPRTGRVLQVPWHACRSDLELVERTPDDSWRQVPCLSHARGMSCLVHSPVAIGAGVREGTGVGRMTCCTPAWRVTWSTLVTAGCIQPAVCLAVSFLPYPHPPDSRSRNRPPCMWVLLAPLARLRRRHSLPPDVMWLGVTWPDVMWCLLPWHRVLPSMTSSFLPCTCTGRRRT
jgi:hypothetical protein